jgi:hypothetical protein
MVIFVLSKVKSKGNGALRNPATQQWGTGRLGVGAFYGHVSER